MAGNAPTWQQLRTMSDDELAERFDQHARNTIVGLDWYREEFARREATRLQCRIFALSVLVGIAAFVQAVTAVVIVATR